MAQPIPLSRPDLTQKEIDAVTDVLHGNTLSIGPRLEAFEQRCAKLTGRRHAIGVSSGTSGLHCCMLAAGIDSGDEVITTPFSFVASTNCILYVGARPVFVDIDPKTLNMDVDRVAEKITPNTKAIVGVEAFGHPGGMVELEQLAQQHELMFIEDSCEGFGGHVVTPNGERAIGSFGRAGVFGFYPNKQITTGEGGMIVTDDDNFAAACRALRNQGREDLVESGALGPPERRVEFTEAVIPPESFVRESRRTLAPLVAQRPTRRGERVVVGDDHATLAGRDLLVRIKAENRGATE